MATTMVLTVLLEGVVVVLFSCRHHKPWPSLLVTSVAANVVTQALLWGVLSVFFQHYLAALLLAEVVIWGVEAAVLWGVPGNEVSPREALLLSLYMNLCSFGAGWFLPV